LKFKYNQKQ